MKTKKLVLCLTMVILLSLSLCVGCLAADVPATTKESTSATSATSATSQQMTGSDIFSAPAPTSGDAAGVAKTTANEAPKPAPTNATKNLKTGGMAQIENLVTMLLLIGTSMVALAIGLITYLSLEAKTAKTFK